jgi:3-hydroxyacyl-[acyl-carrier-protein] dehydratase
MDKNELMTILPHRDAMLLIDEASVVGGEARAKKTIQPDEWFLQGHFPNNPIVPGVILCEILAQSTCVLLASDKAECATTLLAGLNNVRFRNPVRPGDVFETRCTIIKQKPPFYWAQGSGFVNGVLCVSAEFSFVLN